MAPERLVQQQDRRLQHERASEGHPLPLAAGELAGHPVGEDIGLEPDHLQRPPDPVGDLGFGGFPLLQPEGDVPRDREVGKERVVLEDHRHLALVGPLLVHRLAQQPNLTAVVVRLLEAGQQPEGGGLAAAGGAQQGKELAPVDVERDVVHGLHVSKGLGDAGRTAPRVGPWARRS